MSIETISENKSFGGVQGVYSHQSESIGGVMRVSVFQPPAALDGQNVPVVTYLSGLTCTEENFTVKASAQRVAAELGLMVVAPDTSPRHTDFPGEHEAYDYGSGAGFYVDATEAPWSQAYKMYSYVTRDLPAVIAANFPADLARQGIFGHSMGGHGALTIAFKHPETYTSVSAFSPICAPMQCPWGEKALTGYLGADRETWRAYDASELVTDTAFAGKILIDQGSDDQFLAEQLKPEILVAAAEAAGKTVALRMQPGYDHSYYFIATFIEDHLRHHAGQL